MRTFATLLALAMTSLVTCYSQVISIAPDNDKAVGDTIAGALSSKDPRIVLSAIFQLDKPCGQRSEAYFQSVEKAIGTLSMAASNSPAVGNALSSLFTNVMQAPFPTNTAAAASILDSKCSDIIAFLNNDEIRGSQSTWIAIAQFIGQVRSQIVPSYVPKGYLNPPGATGASLDQIAQAISENSQNHAMDHLQTTLQSVDRKLTFFLVHNGYRFSSGDPRKADFINKVSGAAHLTKEEVGEINK